MSKNQCILVIGEEIADILNLTEKEYDVLNCHYVVEQVTDESGKTTPRLTNSGTVQMILPQLPSDEIIEWGLIPEGIMIVPSNQFFDYLCSMGYAYRLDSVVTMPKPSYPNDKALEPAGTRPGIPFSICGNPVEADNLI